MFDQRATHMRLDSFGKNHRLNAHARITALVHGGQKVAPDFTSRRLVAPLLRVYSLVWNGKENSLNPFVRSYHCYVIVSCVVIVHNCSILPLWMGVLEFIHRAPPQRVVKGD